MSDIKIKSKLINIEIIVQKILKYIFSAVIGFLIAKTGIKNLISPFSVSYLAVVPESELSFLSTFGGIIAGYITNDFSIVNFKYICANTIILAIIAISGRRNYIKNIYSPVLPAIVSAGVGTVFLFAERISLFGVLLVVFESLLSGCSAYFLRYFIISAQNRNNMDTKDIIAFNITLLILICAIDNYYILGLSVSIIFLILLVYICAYYLNSKTSLIFTLSLCFIISILRIENHNLFLILYVPAVFSILISKLDKKYIVPAYLTVYCTVYTITGISFLSLKNLFLPLISGGIFFLIPKNKFGGILSIFFNTKSDYELKPDDNKLCLQYCKSTNALIESINGNVIEPVLDNTSEIKLKKYLQKLNCKNIQLNCYIGSGYKQIYSLVCESNKPIDLQQINQKLSDLTNCDFAVVNNKSEGEIISCRFEQKDNYKIECYGIYKPKRGEKICGDNLCAFKTNYSVFNIILADGMGSGKDAYTKSFDTINILKKLLKSNVDPVAAIKTANSSIAMIKDEIGFSTIDLCSVSLKSGIAEFYKCGAYVSFILRNKTLIKIKENGMPAGLFENIAITEQKMQLVEGDIIIMMSDGVSNSISEIEATALISENAKPEIIARDIMECANINTPPDMDDDITVIVSKFSKNL